MDEKHEYPRVKNQLRIHWHWLRLKEDYDDIYEFLKVWIKQDEEIRERKEGDINGNI